ncbi:putative tyramine receptor 2 [Cryptotermes secundus]|uniref:Putative tyramine receptor 2 n=1 Tax=Cryptotermes secundus TaxID=105785 RepID=A0A2J7PXP4_9NEOP|nr:putative tyramine receptor 2 [Cryptotermes secundus]XP_023719813.1 putative tyramine receptor 2 [Cryptotermes secundus]XP_023719814.1 putative tyramine receptor 2 [Cryptotermes secundus]XP_033610015.1 putative tyramine receptor 2 [Cryptotermes secundus]XP_033610016.1 putative tyramine receptor 2 [Cryptotermes secundus]XP_033610017.1 putative tyramine receptor 2 [Cryptotermes secundus]XP_033610018.1 putative tyramine receptor 2 [Cryptotermes secundus]PNF21102.1 putative tyramine receptor 2
MANIALNEADDAGRNCSAEINLYNSSLGITLAVPDWEAVTTGLILTLVIMMILIGNILIILSIFKHKALRNAQNFFLVSLAVADLTVAVFVLPFSVIYQIVGRWKFGINLCKMWLTFDVLCCTASILHLCVIALDRYWAITDPLNYARKRTHKRVLVMIGGVWVLSIAISSPPLIGWNDWESVLRNGTVCELTIEQGYIVYSSLGSFFIPLFIMSLVYAEIFIATKRRLRQRAKASKLSAVTWNRHPNSPREQDSTSSDTNQNNHFHMTEERIKENTNKSKKKKDNDGCSKEKHRKKSLVTEESITDNDENPQLGSQCLKDLHNSNEEGPNPPSSRTTTARTGPEMSTPATVRGSAIFPSSSTRKHAPVNLFMQVKQRISLSKERRAARTLGIIMGVFVVCWLPFFLMYVIVPFCVSCCPSDKLKHFMTWLGYINSALNPIIYTIFNMDFRRAFKKLLHIK